MLKELIIAAYLMSLTKVNYDNRSSDCFNASVGICRVMFICVSRGVCTWVHTSLFICGHIPLMSLGQSLCARFAMSNSNWITSVNVFHSYFHWLTAASVSWYLLVKLPQNPQACRSWAYSRGIYGVSPNGVIAHALFGCAKATAWEIELPYAPLHSLGGAPPGYRTCCSGASLVWRPCQPVPFSRQPSSMVPFRLQVWHTYYLTALLKQDWKSGVWPTKWRNGMTWL